MLFNQELGWGGIDMHKTRNCFLFFLIFYGAILTGYSGADIVSVSGSVEDGGTITINGTGFGSGDISPLLWDNFESGSNGSSLPANPKSGSWTIVNGGPVFSNSSAHSGSMSATSYYSSGNGFKNIRWERMSLSSGATYYQSYWFRYNTPAGGNGQTKLTQLWGTEQINDYSPGVMTGGFAGSWWSTYIALEGSGAYQQASYPLTPSQNQWHLFEMILRQSDVNVANGRVTILIDGKTVYDRNPVKTREHSGHGWLFTSFFDGMTNWGGATQTWIDDVYFNDSWARVVLGNASTYNNSTIREIQIPTNWNSNGQSITVTCNTGSFSTGQTAFLYVIDSTGTVSSGRAVTIGQSSSGGSTPPPTDAAPTVGISSPTANSTYSATSSSINLAGSASDDNGISSVTWRNSLTGNSGTATLTSGSWSASGIALQSGTNAITVTARDTAGQTATDTLSVSYTEPTGGSGSSDVVWDAASNIGGGQWYNSGVTYCARILIPGSQITRSGDTIKLGFQGRSSGDYQIKSVSIAQRDSNGNVGDVVDSTWTKVTFNKKGEVYHDILSGDSWENYNVTVPQGAEKVSNPIRFDIVQGQDYYVTFKIVTPSVYQYPPAGYSELYFDSADHTQDRDWSGTGFGTTQDYHALSNIYITTEMASPNMQ